ncbi:surfeit locus protein 1 [Chelonus insularis]|uniref:surfeit locus protein 1 n=1 Tax=Chelonus insularis TaxID=460826 RepID=UPI001588AF4B|nr:surfeit locus protein 1 [Chelonus insularis]
MSITSLITRLLKVNKRCNILNFNKNLSQQVVKLEKPELRFKKSKVTSKFQRVTEDDDDDAPGFTEYALISIPIITFILGTWQVERRRWKLNLIEELKQRTTSSPVPLPDDLSQLQDMEYMPVKVKGEFLYDKEFLLGPRSLILDGKPASEKSVSSMGGSNKYSGYYVVTPFKVKDRDLIILVNRGWIRTRLDKMPPEKLGHVSGVVEITGLVRHTEQRPPFMKANRPETGIWSYRNIGSMALEVGVDPVFIDLTEECDVPNGPIPGQTLVDLRNEHLSYIFTWYLLSGLSGLMWYRQVIKRLPAW